MCDKTDSCSLTPPNSPLLLHMEDFMESSPPKLVRRSTSVDESCPAIPAVSCFLCGGDVHGLCISGLHDNSVIKRGTLKQVIGHSRDSLPDGSVVLREILGYQFVTQIDLIEHMDRLFLLAKSCVSSIQRGVVGPFDEGPGDLRKQMKQFMDYIKEFLLHYMPSDTLKKEVFLTALMSELHGLLLYTGRLTEVLQYTSHPAPFFGNKMDSGHHQFHLHLDMYWSLLDVLNVIYTQFGDLSVRQQLCMMSEDCIPDLGYLDQLIQLIIWDLITAANVKFHKVSTCSDHLQISPFTCTCVQELWIMLIHLTTHRNKALGEESFWVRFYHIIQEVCDEQELGESRLQEYDSDVFINPPGPKPKHPVGFSLWLILHVAHLFQFDDAGDLRPLEPTHNNYFVVKNILQKKLAQSSVSEMELRVYLHCCVKLARIWEPETSLLVLLWDHFYRRLKAVDVTPNDVKLFLRSCDTKGRYDVNNNFQVTSTSLEGLAQVSKSAQSLLHQCKKWCSQLENTDKENSFHLFLCLLATQISRLIKAGSVQEWRQMKGRFCSKFHQRRMQELSEVGLYNFTCLFLTLVNVTEVEDMGRKLCDFYNMLDPSNTSLNRRIITWMGGLALSRICVEKNTDMAFVAEKLSASFNSVCRDFSDSNLDPQRRHALWRMITLYLEGLQDIFEASSSLTTSEYKLLGEDLSQVFRVCRDGEMRFIITTLQTIASKFRSVLKDDACVGTASAKLKKDHHQAISSYLWTYIYPFVKDHATTLTPPLTLADLAVDFCLMARDQSSGMIPTREDFTSVFQHFSSKDSVKVSLSCHFLCQVLSEDGMLDFIISTNRNAQTQLLQAWIRCVVLLPPSSNHLHTVTSIALGLPGIRKVFESARMDVPTDMESAPKLFLRALGKQYADTQDLRERMLLRDQVMEYFSNVPHHISPILRNMGPEETLTSMYTSVGHLIKYCAPMLFAQTKTDCPLPNIISSMIVPHFLYKTDKPVHPLFLNSVRSNLHLFVQGLGKLDFKRAPYVNRRLGDIVNLYLTRFPVSSLCGSYVQSPSQESLDLRHLVLEIVHNNYLQLKNLSLPQSASVGLAYVTEVLQRTKDMEVIARDSKLFLHTIMEYMLLGSLPAIKQHASRIIKHLLEACVLHPTVVTQNELVTILRKFVNTYLKLQAEGVFQILEKLAVISSSLLTQLIPDMTSAVRELERKRGVGVDQVLRKFYFSVLTHLADAGTEEIQKLQTENNT